MYMCYLFSRDVAESDLTWHFGATRLAQLHHITATSLSDVSVTLATTTTGSTGTVTAVFRTSSGKPIPADGKILVIPPYTKTSLALRLSRAARAVDALEHVPCRVAVSSRPYDSRTDTCSFLK